MLYNFPCYVTLCLYILILTWFAFAFYYFCGCNIYICFGFGAVSDACLTYIIGTSDKLHIYMIERSENLDV